MLTTLTIIGTRPEAIKMGMLIRKLSAHKKIRNFVCVTGQHREMLDQVLHFFEITPDFDLQVMQQGQTLNDLSAAILSGLQPILSQLNPDLVLVHGDTNTTFAAALAAFYMKIPVAHIEAGMRTYQLYAPFPEEANRVLTGQLVSWHFAPTTENVAHLLHEHILRKKIIKTGNTVIDSLLFATNKVKGFSSLVTDKKLITAVSEKKRYLLVTGHRRENFGPGFKSICTALRQIAIQHPDLNIIYPVHLNPNVQEPVNRILKNMPNIVLTSPLSYPDFIYLMKGAYIILTDSGGIQEEGPSLGKPVLVMRTITERPEAVKAGTVQLVGTNKEKIIRSVSLLLTDTKRYERMSKKNNPYGDGKASDRIIDWLVKNSALIKHSKPV